MQPQNDHAKTSSRAGVYQATASHAQQEQKKANADPLGQTELVVCMRVGRLDQAKKVNALVDTGSQLSIITWALVVQLGLAAFVERIPVAIAAVSRDGSQTAYRITHKIKLILSLATGVLGVHEFLVNPNPKLASVAVPLVLGWDFARAFHLNIDWTKGGVRFKAMKPFATIAYNVLKAAASAAAARRAQVVAESNKYGIPTVIRSGRRPALKGPRSLPPSKLRNQISFDSASSSSSSTRKHRRAAGHSRHAGQSSSTSSTPSSSTKYAALVLLGLAARGRQRRSAAPSPESARSSSLGVSQASRRGHIFNPEFKVVEIVQADGTRKKVIVAKEKVKGAEQQRRA
ncbi:hypothetical protein BCR35DRAFT_298458 [Leucosporidium creatinivorum]|uniref:Uncharacterized protein n=1 Tax=Leucosporidium creatinivorum TaxID=106004 RepID=A0A1Y2G4L8_9BASI|nr:hypothetical protein BCR35DRAFT_298458 [Leucosporidium creatinivorum]